MNFDDIDAASGWGYNAAHDWGETNIITATAKQGQRFGWTVQRDALECCIVGSRGEQRQPITR